MMGLNFELKRLTIIKSSDESQKNEWSYFTLNFILGFFCDIIFMTVEQKPIPKAVS